MSTSESSSVISVSDARVPGARTGEPAPRDRLEALRHDERGAIMVVTVFMAAFLVGGLWYIIGIGDVILYKERMQDGADAVAYSAAVYHARGMNIIAMINIIMAGILAVLVAMKLVQVMNTIANIVSCALSWTGVGAAVCSFTSGLQAPIANAINGYERAVVKTTLPALSKAQEGVAVAMPWVAEAKAVYVSMNYYSEPVEGGAILSTSLLPYVPKERLGLPVQKDKYSTLCGKAGEFVGEVAFMPFGKFGSWVGGVIGSITKTFPGYFCGSGGAMGFDFDSSTIDMTCREKRKKHKEDHGSDAPFDMDRCKKDTKKDFQRDSNEKIGGMGSSAGGNTSFESMTPKKVFDWASNGSAFMQVYSVVMGNMEWPKTADRGVQIAAWNQRDPEMEAAPWGRIGLAQAEFYNDQPGPWEDQREDSMWNMRWRARMRRVRPPTGEVATIIGSVLGNKLLDKVEDKFLDAIAGSDAFDYMLGRGLGDKAKRWMRKVLVSGGRWADEKVENVLLSDQADIEIIH